MAIVINGSGTITGISTGGLPDGIVDDGTLATSAVTSTKIADGTITNADINASAAIAGSKLTGIKTVNGDSLIGSGDLAVGLETYLGAAPITSSNSAFTTFVAVADTEGGMNASTGVYTVQTTGKYIISCTHKHDSATSTRDIVNLKINGSITGEIVETHMLYTDQTGQMVRSLSSGDTLVFWRHSLSVDGPIEVEIRRVL